MKQSHQLKRARVRGLVSWKFKKKRYEIAILDSGMCEEICQIGFPSSSAVKNPPTNAGDAEEVGSIPGSGRSPGEGNGNPFQYSCLENPMDRGTWKVTVHGVAKSWTRLSDFHFHFHFQYSCLENPMGRGAWWVTVHGVAKSWTLLSDFTFTFTMQETWVQSLGREDSLEKGMVTHSNIPAWRTPQTNEPGGLHPQGHKESNRTEATQHPCTWGYH